MALKSALVLHEIQGVLMVIPTNDFRKRNMVRLWTHESLRVFGDRLVDDADREWFLRHLNNMVSGPIDLKDVGPDVWENKW